MKQSPMTHSVGFSSFANIWLHHSTNVNHSSVLQIPQSPSFGNLHLHTGEVWSEASGQCWVSLLTPSVPAAESILLTGWGWTQKIKVWKKMDSSATAGHVLLCWYVTIICLQFFYFIDTERYCAKKKSMTDIFLASFGCIQFHTNSVQARQGYLPKPYHHGRYGLPVDFVHGDARRRTHLRFLHILSIFPLVSTSEQNSGVRLNTHGGAFSVVTAHWAHCLQGFVDLI